MPLNKQLITDALSTVQDPDLNRDLVSLNMVKDILINGNNLHLTIELTTPACPMKDRIRADIEKAVHLRAQDAGETIESLQVEFTADVRKTNQKLQDEANPLPNVKHVIAVGAGKGGVGKSTISVNLAVGLARLGAKTGLLDGDIYGPSIPAMLGLDNLQTIVEGQTLVPFSTYGVKSMSIGKLVPPEKALIWRGPMAHSAFTQLAAQTDWGELDYLIVDLPPGTGDVPLTLAQLLPLTGAVIVCTPQRVAQDDARRAVKMFEHLGVPRLGIVENMSYFVGDDGKEYDLFGRGGAEMLAQEMQLPFLGAVPIHMDLRHNSDAGEPLKNWEGNETLGKELDRLCQNLASQISIATLSGEFVQPTLSVS